MGLLYVGLPVLVACLGLDAAGGLETAFRSREFPAENRGEHELQRYYYH